MVNWTVLVRHDIEKALYRCQGSYLATAIVSPAVSWVLGYCLNGSSPLSVGLSTQGKSVWSAPQLAHYHVDAIYLTAMVEVARFCPQQRGSGWAFYETRYTEYTCVLYQVRDARAPDYITYNTWRRCFAYHAPTKSPFLSSCRKRLLYLILKQ